jgi:hypothetical protein
MNEENASPESGSERRIIPQGTVAVTIGVASRTILGTLVDPILDRLDLRGGCVRAPERHLGKLGIFFGD